MTYLKYLKILILIVIVVNSSLTFAQERKIKPGDAIEIFVYGNEELSRTLLVGAKGIINHPLLDGIPVDGITLQKFQNILVTQLSRFTQGVPLVTVRFTESYPIKVTVLGQVAKPGNFTVSSTANLPSVFFEAGGLLPGARLARIRLIRTEGGKKSNHIVNIEKFYSIGDLRQLPRLKNGDTIVVPGSPLATTVKVLGSVARPGSYKVSFGASLLDVIFLAGGPAGDANLGNVKLLTLGSQQPREIKVNLKDLSNSRIYESLPQVAPGDVVFVSKKGVTWGKFVNLLRDLTVLATLYLIVDRTAN